MNYSPLNDPGFEAYKKNEAAKAAAKRRKKALIILSVTALIAVAATVLLVLAAFDAVSHIGNETSETTTPAPDTPDATPTPETSLPVVRPTSETPTVDTPSASPSLPTEEPTTKTANLRKTTIYVDAGHGFLSDSGVMDHGAGGPGTPYYTLTEELFGTGRYESDLTVNISKKVKELLLNAGYEVIMSREDYAYERLNISARAARAKDAGADVLVSIHANTSVPAAYGTRIYYNYDPSWDLSVESKYFAQNLAVRLDNAGLSRRATLVQGDTEADPTKPLAMLRGTGDIPSILIETLFLTNEGDAALAVTEEWQDGMARCIADAIIDRYPLETKFV